MTQQTKEIPADQIAKYGKDFLLGLYERMMLIREFEDRVKFLFLEGLMPGTIHQSQGQEATATGVCSALKDDDYITSTHRPHAHALAKGLTPDELLIELFGKGTGCCKGKGGSMHVGNITKGMPPAIAIVGGGIPIAAGMALAIKMQKRSQVVGCFFGDGASSEGAFHEAVNMAAIWDLPVIFVCENNLYGASTRVEKITRLEHIADRAMGYGIRGQTVDGNNVLAVYEAALAAAEECRAGKGPVLLELLTYRITGHSRRDPCNYQPKEEREEWRRNEPIKRFAEGLLGRDDIDTADIEQINKRVEQQIEASIKKAQQEPEPTVADLTTEVFV
ncbi:MAG TPA: thiamine pyrophosphate-dependent dehydrogenase E1 component subunit alpha [Phycisphaerae bacterium]|nr:thiamine pyrophosphate-dependent dehydrogenase E1 component subunit alpha [Phycisphaerae bacterium]